MSYIEARKCFDENRRVIGDPMSNPLLWNLSVGLSFLADAAEADAKQLKAQIAQLAQAQQRQK